MSEPNSNPEVSHDTGTKPRWERPSLIWLGDLKDLVRGGGKVSGQHDQDTVDPRLQLEKPHA